MRLPVELEHLSKFGEPAMLQPLLDAIEAEAGEVIDAVTQECDS